MFRRYSYTIIRECSKHELMRSLNDDGVKYTEACQSCFNVNLILFFLRQLTSASVGE